MQRSEGGHMRSQAPALVVCVSSVFRVEVCEEALAAGRAAARAAARCASHGHIVAAARRGDRYNTEQLQRRNRNVARTLFEMVIIFLDLLLIS